MLVTHIILTLLWIVYCMLHSLLASIRLKKKLEQTLKTGYKYYRLFYTIFAFLFLVGLLYLQVSISTIELYKVTVFIRVTGSAIALSGLTLMLVCIKKYFIGLSGLLSLIQEKNSSSLLITGVHKYVRHPLYLGTFAFIWGAVLVLPYLSLLIANCIITGYTLVGIKLEEDKLIAEFGESYKTYQRSVPKLIPFTKPQQ